MNTIEEIADVVKRLKSAVIFTHTRPDGDAIGSALALSRAFSLLKIKNEVVNDSEISEKFEYLRGVKLIRRTPTLDADGYFCVDASDETRLGELQRVFQRESRKKITVNIDHHVSNTLFCRYNYVRERSSNCENVAELILALGIKYDEEIASALMTGIVTDSGTFSHSDVKGDTFRAAALAADAGADVNQITYYTFRRQTKARAMMYLETLNELRFLHEDKLAVALVTQERLTKYSLKQDATEGIVDFALTIEPVEVSVCLLEVKRGQYKASFRSKGRVNVNEIAGTFGGGGHILASGCMFFGELEEVLERLSYAVWQYLGDI